MQTKFISAAEAAQLIRDGDTVGLMGGGGGLMEATHLFEAVQERFRRGEPTWINPTDLRGKRVWYSRSIGMAPMMADVVMDRVRESAAATVV